MKLWQLSVCPIIAALSISINVYAATPSNYEDIDDETIEMDSDQYIESDQTSGTSTLESIKDILIDIKDAVIPEEVEEDEISIDRAAGPVLLAFDNSTNHNKNVVVYHGSFDNQSADLVIPYAAYSNLDIVNGYLVNVGSSSVTGRILYDGAVLDPDDYETYTYVLNTLYSNPSNVYNYGSYNYQRHYYVNAGRLTYNDTFGKFYVDDVDVYYSASERPYYMQMVTLLFLGVMFLWIRKRL